MISQEQDKTVLLQNLFEKYKRPHNLSDLDILWAIRDIPRSTLNTSLKGILSMLVAIIGNNSFCSYSQKDLTQKLGCTEKTMSRYFYILENLGFLIINTPNSYATHETNQYCLNYELIMETALCNRNVTN